ncbi:MAG: hypothetical protein A2X86_08740 [Bdellovibrionales bacterium GWA2_49_15]|nr:MAG: hypothetical protein A2X86_08740 [Bdellovibrionales bacterium GWA2_49_15]HAZ13948.1 hypothetical protein [Bdellovibrionales bacterium]
MALVAIIVPAGKAPLVTAKVCVGEERVVAPLVEAAGVLLREKVVGVRGADFEGPEGDVEDRGVAFAVGAVGLGGVAARHDRT